MAMLAESVDGVIGVDTHRDTLTAAAVTNLGGVLAHTTTGADAAGYQQLLGFARGQVPGRRLWAVARSACTVARSPTTWLAAPAGRRSSRPGCRCCGRAARPAAARGRPRSAP